MKMEKTEEKPLDEKPLEEKPLEEKTEDEGEEVEGPCSSPKAIAMTITKAGFRTYAFTSLSYWQRDLIG